MSDEATTPEQAAERPGEFIVPIRVVDFDEHPASYVNLVQINFDRAAFQMVLIQFLPPPVGAEALGRLVEEQGFLQAKVMARLVLTEEMVELLIRDLTSQLEAFRAQPKGEAQTR